MTRVSPLARKIEPLKCMGNWFVQVAIPTPFDRGAHNGLEQYSWDEEEQRVKVKYTFSSGSFEAKPTIVYQKGRVAPGSEDGTLWQVKPWLKLCYLPVWLSYVIIDVDEAYSHMVCSSPKTSGAGNAAPHRSTNTLALVSLTVTLSRTRRVDVHHDA